MRFTLRLAPLVALVVASGLASVLSTAPAEAKPVSMWDDPAAKSLPPPSELAFAHAWAMELVQSALSEGGLHGPHAGEANALLVNARALLVRYGAETSNDARLRLDLGRVLVELADYSRAVPVLEGALALAGDAHPGAEDAWFSLAISHAHLGQRDREVAAYLRALPLEDSPYGRHVVLGNLAEARMGLGQLDLALEAGEEALQIDPDSTLVRWTMAVIRDRAGDGWGALEDAKQAIATDPSFSQLESPDVFFEPSWEVHWYRALGEQAWAEKSTDEIDRELHLLAAIQAFDKYLQQAWPSDRYRKLAAAHVLRLEQQLGLAAPKPGGPSSNAKPPKK